MRPQKTLRHAIGCVGVGLHSGARVGLTLRPAEAGSGLRFRRVDRPAARPVPARLDQVADHPGPTSLGQPAVRMVEHLLAALLACEIDNALVELSGPELPAMDGSAMPFVLLIECAGTRELDEPVAEIEVVRPVAVAEGDRWARLEPAEGLHLAIGDGPDGIRFAFSPEACKRELAGAREEGLRGEPRFAGDEALRHDALDALGDLALIPARLHARYAAWPADRSLRRRLLRDLLANPSAWRLRSGAPLPAGLLPQTAPAGSRLAG